MLTNYSCSWGLPWNLVDISSDISLKNYPRSYQPWIASLLGVGLSPLDAGIFLLWACARLLHALTVSVSSRCAPALLCMENTVSWKVIHHFWFLEPFFLLPTPNPNMPSHKSLSQGVMKAFLIGLSTLKSLNFGCCPIVGLCINSHLQEEASLIRAEWHTHVWV